MSEPMAATDLAPTPPAPGLQQSADGDFCIPAKRMKDGSVCFYVTIEHLIEQTLLRALNRPEFRKTPVVVKEDETLTQPLPAAATVDAEPAAKVPSVPIKLQLKRKYREVAAGTEVDTSTATVCGSEAKRRQELSSSPHTATCSTSRLVESDFAAEHFGSPAAAAAAAEPDARVAGQAPVGVGRHAWLASATAAAAAASGSGRRTSPAALATERRSSSSSSSSSGPPAEHRPSMLQSPVTPTVQLHGGAYQPQPVSADERFALRDRPLPPEDDDVALDLSAKRPSTAVTSSSPANVSNILPSTGAATGGAGDRSHDFHTSLRPTSKELNEGSNYHQPALPPAILMEHYVPFGHIFHHQAAAAAAAGSELAAMMQGADLKDWHQFSAAAAAATLAAGRPPGYPLSSWPISPPSPLALSMMQPPARTLAGGAAAATPARPLK